MRKNYLEEPGANADQLFELAINLANARTFAGKGPINGDWDWREGEWWDLEDEDPYYNWEPKPEAKAQGTYGKYAQQLASGGRVGMKEGDIVKAGKIRNLFEKVGINVSGTPAKGTNISRMADLYGVEKYSSGKYIEPSAANLQNIKKAWDINQLKAPGVTKTGAEAFTKRYARIKELLTQGLPGAEVNRVIAKEFPEVKEAKTSVYRAIKDLRNQGINITSGRGLGDTLGKNLRVAVTEKFPNVKFDFNKYKYGVPTTHAKYSKVLSAVGAHLKTQKLRSANIGKVSSTAIEKELRMAKKGAGVDLAHRASLSQSAKLNRNYLSSNLGIDKPSINREIIKPIEDELKKLYRKQSDLVKQAKKYKTVPIELQKKLDAINKQISEVAVKSKGRLHSVLVDEKTLKPKVTGINYGLSADLGVVDKTVTKMTKMDKAVFKLNMANAIAAEKGRGTQAAAKGIGSLAGKGALRGARFIPGLGIVVTAGLAGYGLYDAVKKGYTKPSELLASAAWGSGVEFEDKDEETV